MTPLAYRLDELHAAAMAISDPVERTAALQQLHDAVVIERDRLINEVAMQQHRITAGKEFDSVVGMIFSIVAALVIFSFLFR